jgi:glutamate synthase domain-containing protein 3
LTVLADSSAGPLVAVVSIPEIREYPRINAEVVRHLDAGHARVLLTGAGGHRLLLSGLAGAWDAVVEIEGHAGPELAADMDAPGLTVVCRGPVADGAARDLRAGRIAILGDAGDATAYSQRGGAVLVAGSAGHRAGLGQAGGSLVLLGEVGRLAGERQGGGRLWAAEGKLGPHAGRARRGGAFIRIAPDADADTGMAPDDADALSSLMRAFAPWIGPYFAGEGAPLASSFPPGFLRPHLTPPLA